MINTDWGKRRTKGSALSLIAICSTLYLVPGGYAEDRTFRLKLALDKSKVSSDSFLITRVVNTGDLTIESARQTSFSRNLNITVSDPYRLVAVTAGSLHKNTLVAGLARIHPQTRTLPALKLKKRRAKRPPVGARSVSATFAPSPLETSPYNGMAVVALRDSDFSVSGPETSPWMALGGRDVVATEMASAECHRKEDGFIISETSPEFFRARAQEIALCEMGNNAACFDPQSYVPPNSSVRGSFTSDGANVAIALSFFDETGAEAATASTQGPFASFIDLLVVAGRDLGQEICRSRELKVTIAPTGLSQGNCAYTEAGGCTCADSLYGFYWEGGHYIGEVRGPVGTSLEISSSEGETATGNDIACGEWTRLSCEHSLCCRRDTGQPALAHFDAQLNFPLHPRLCECRVEVPSISLTAKAAKGGRVKSESLTVNCPL